MNHRRKLIVALGASALAAPFRIFAQPVKKSVVVGILGVQDQPSAEPLLSAFKQGLQEFGYVEGKNPTLQLRFADGKSSACPDLRPSLQQQIASRLEDVPRRPDRTKNFHGRHLERSAVRAQERADVLEIPRA